REKLAALGGLVAGVAHEINTPLGVTLTALSVVDERVAALKADVLAGTATRRRFVEHLDSLSDATRLAVENGRRAASLVTSFKKVAVDQASEAVRLVEFPDYLHHVVDSLRPLIKQAKVRVEIGGDTVQIHTRPGQIVQVLTNLISNSITHGLEDHPDPTITIYARRAPKGMWLVVEDNGWGMSEEVRRRAFEPFFTTRMGRGGSGLGLHIVYNIVVEALGGEVEVDSAPGQGTCFRLFFPHQLPSLRESSE
ncbi:MAG TPA: HAMP domain-containing sensor histidine kinase, partial [Myxococcota bacterium]|nr:HAMP domain-containing sensor histidine kinase [Myxococcota bacterium]